MARDSANSHPAAVRYPPGTAGDSGQRASAPRARGRRARPTRSPGLAARTRGADQVHDIRRPLSGECEKLLGGAPRASRTPTRSESQWIEVPRSSRTSKQTRPATKWTCPCCGHKTRAAYDEQEIPRHHSAAVDEHRALLTGGLPRKPAQRGQAAIGPRRCPDLARRVSAVEARVSEAVEPPVAEAWQRVEGAPSSTPMARPAHSRAVLALWPNSPRRSATVFKIVANGSACETLAPLYGALRGILASDRATALTFWADGAPPDLLGSLSRAHASLSGEVVNRHPGKPTTKSFSAPDICRLV